MKKISIVVLTHNRVAELLKSVALALELPERPS